MKQGTVVESHWGCLDRLVRAGFSEEGSFRCALKDGRVYFEPESATLAMLLETNPLGRAKPSSVLSVGVPFKLSVFSPEKPILFF